MHGDRQPVFVGAALTNPERPVRDYEQYKCDYQHSSLTCWNSFSPQRGTITCQLLKQAYTVTDLQNINFIQRLCLQLTRLEGSLGVNSALDGIRPKVEANNGAETRPLKSVEPFQYL